MRRRIELEFDNGQVFFAELLEEEAPETCRQVWGALPIETELGHTISHGMVLNVRTAALGVKHQENPRVFGMSVGDIVLNTMLDNFNEPRSGWQQIGIICGPAMYLSYRVGWEPANLFAHVVEGSLNELVAIWRDVHHNGAQRIGIRQARTTS